MRQQQRGQDVWYRASTQTWLHRCHICWWANGRIDNGFKPLDQRCQHAAWCEYKDRF